MCATKNCHMLKTWPFSFVLWDFLCIIHTICTIIKLISCSPTKEVLFIFIKCSSLYRHRTHLGPWCNNQRRKGKSRVVFLGVHLPLYLQYIEKPPHTSTSYNNHSHHKLPYTTTLTISYLIS